jgi:phosphohistidine swiveling domain-containing protein
MSPAALVLELDAAAAKPSRALLGGKGLSLALLEREGLPVPRTTILTTRFFKAHAPSLAALERAFERGKRPPRASVTKARAMLSRPLAPALLETAVTALGQLLATAPSGKIAVRSSAAGEDGEEATFAGLHDTVLGVASVEDALRAVRRCWESLLSERALEYRARRRIRSPLAMAVVCQEHVEAEAAGVAFSAVGTGERRRLVVELAPPGESAPVTGSETPRRFEVPRVPGGGASRGDVALAVRALGKGLPLERAVEVVRLALTAEDMLDRPADIEWLLTRERGVVLVQARPAQAARAPRYDRTAVAESLPGAMKPLARDFVVRAYGRAFARHHGSPLALASRILVYAAGRFYLDTWALARSLEKRSDVKDEKLRAVSVGAAQEAVASLRAVDRAPSWKLWRGVLATLDRILPLYLLAQDDVALIQETILRARARLGLPLGAPPAFETGLDLVRGLAGRDLLVRFGHRGGIELDLASPSFAETGFPDARHAARPRRRRDPDADHSSIRGLLRLGRRAAHRADLLRDAIALCFRKARGQVLATGRGEDVFFLHLSELERILQGKRVHPDLRPRKKAYEREHGRTAPLMADDPEHEESLATTSGKTLSGVAASSGKAKGKARVVHTARDVGRLRRGEVLVAHAATADLFATLLGAAALVTDVGGMLSHGAILAREVGIPAVVATGEASRVIETGDLVHVDGERGVVEILD